MTEPMTAADACEHYYETRILGGRAIAVRACTLCRTPDWADLDEQAAELYRWGWEEGRAGKPVRGTLSAYDKPLPADGYEATTGHAITCTAAFTDICDCGPAASTTPQDGLSGPQGGPGVASVGAAPEGPGGAQAGAGGFTPCRDTQHCAYHGWCHRCDPAFAAAMTRVNIAIQRTDTEPSHWGPLYEAVGQALRGHLPTPAAPGEWLRIGTRDLSIPDHDRGPSVAEAADNDRRWDLEKGGE